MKYRITKIFSGAAFVIYLLAFAISSCKKEVTTHLPGNQEAVEFNFYPASDVFRTYIPGATHTPIYVDPLDVDSSFKSNTNPSFFYELIGTAEDYPSSRDIGVVTYSPYNAGGHRIIFADNANIPVLDTAIDQAVGSYNCLYFADAPATANAIAKYKMIAIQEDRSGSVPGQVGIRFIHLAPDAGTLRCSRFRADGSLTNAAPAPLNYGEYTPYIYFTARDTVGGLLRFSLDNPANGASVITAVPYTPGRKYAIVINGFLNDQQRQVPAGRNPDSTLFYKPVSILRNLRASIRRIY